MLSTKSLSFSNHIGPQWTREVLFTLSTAPRLREARAHTQTRPVITSRPAGCQLMQTIMANTRVYLHALHNEQCLKNWLVGTKCKGFFPVKLKIESNAKKLLQLIKIDRQHYLNYYFFYMLIENLAFYLSIGSKFTYRHTVLCEDTIQRTLELFVLRLHKHAVKSVGARLLMCTVHSMLSISIVDKKRKYLPMKPLESKFINQYNQYAVLNKTTGWEKSMLQNSKYSKFDLYSIFTLIYISPQSNLFVSLSEYILKFKKRHWPDFYGTIKQ